MSLINKMLIDLDRRMEEEPKRSTTARLLAGLRPAVKEKASMPSRAARLLAVLRPAAKEQVTTPSPAAELLAGLRSPVKEPAAKSSRRRYELVGLLAVVLLLSVGTYTWQKMPRPVASLEKMAEVASAPAVEDPFAKSSEAPDINLPAVPNRANAERTESSRPHAAGGLVVEAEPPEGIDAPLEAEQAGDEESSSKRVASVHFPLAVTMPETAHADPAEKPKPKRVEAAKKIPAPVKHARVVVPAAPAVRAAPVAPAIAAESAGSTVSVVPPVPALAPAAVLPPAQAFSVPSSVPALVQAKPSAAIGFAAPVPSRNAGFEKKPAGNNSDVADDIHRDAAALFEQGRLAEAYEKYRDALTHDPRHVKAREGLVTLLLQQGSAEEAQEVLYEGINAVPGHFAFGQQLARLYAEQGKNEKALALLESSRELGKSNADYLGFLAAIYQRSGRSAQAQETYMQALALRPLEGRWWAGLAISYEAENKWGAARDAYAHVRASLNVDAKLADYAEKRMAALAGKM